MLAAWVLLWSVAATLITGVAAFGLPPSERQPRRQLHHQRLVTVTFLQVSTATTSSTSSTYNGNAPSSVSTASSSASASTGTLGLEESSSARSSTSTTSSSRTLYDVLGASMTDSRAEIKQKYVQLAKLSHPDALLANNPSLPPSSPQEQELPLDFNEIATAYQILSDVKQRRRYDRSLKAANVTEHIAAFCNKVVSDNSNSVAELAVAALDKIALPFFKRTTATTLSAYQAAVLLETQKRQGASASSSGSRSGSDNTEALSSSSRTNDANDSALQSLNTKPSSSSSSSLPLPRLNVVSDLVQTWETALQAAHRASLVLDAQEWTLQSHEVHQQAVVEYQRAVSVRLALQRSTTERLLLALHTAQSDLTADEALLLLDFFQTSTVPTTVSTAAAAAATTTSTTASNNAEDDASSSASASAVLMEDLNMYLSSSSSSSSNNDMSMNGAAAGGSNAYANTMASSSTSFAGLSDTSGSGRGYSSSSSSATSGSTSTTSTVNTSAAAAATTTAGTGPSIWQRLNFLRQSVEKEIAILQRNEAEFLHHQHLDAAAQDAFQSAVRDRILCHAALLQARDKEAAARAVYDEAVQAAQLQQAKLDAIHNDLHAAEHAAAVSSTELERLQTAVAYQSETVRIALSKKHRALAKNQNQNVIAATAASMASVPNDAATTTTARLDWPVLADTSVSDAENSMRLQELDRRRHEEREMANTAAALEVTAAKLLSRANKLKQKVAEQQAQQQQQQQAQR